MKRMMAVAAALMFLGGPAIAAEADQILALTEKVADWQLQHLQTGYVPSQPNDQASPRGWVYGALWDGMTALADVSPEPRFTDAVIAQGERQRWELEQRPFHADDYVIGRSWVWAFQRTADQKAVAALKARLDSIIAASPNVPLDYGATPPPFVESACQLRWCWADALFMGPPTFAALSDATGDRKYVDYADREFWTTTAFLFDKDEHLFARDSRFFSRRGPQGEKIFWSRGNGWVFAGIARMLELLPANHPSRPRYVALLREMAARLVTLQKPDGYWPVSLLSPPSNTPPETSGTGFYTFGLAYGVRAGLLPELVYRAAATRGWQALARAVDPDGKLGWVQQIGVGPDAVHVDDTQLYGVGAFLLAGSQMYQLALHDGVAAMVGQDTVAKAGYAVDNINSVSMSRNNLFSVGGYQFAAFYGAPQNGRVTVLVARRSLKGGDWQVAATPFSQPDEFSNTGTRDDHNIVAAAVDGRGRLHLSWGMHNAPLTYAVSSQSVLSQAFPEKIAMTTAKMVGTDENEVTYPEFIRTADGTLMFAYRNGGTGGGSGNGNEHLNRYDARAKTWQRIASPMVDGISTSMNAYLNSFTFDAKGSLFASWTIRETPGWTNHDIYLARSDDGGRTWSAYDGTPLGRTITRASADAHAKILSLPIGTNLINQTSMTIDAAGRPEIATWWSPEIGRGIATRQYMLVWNDGRAWRATPVSRRDALEPNDPVAAKVREMGRPLVLTDRAGRTVVVTRSTAAGRPVSDDSNRVTVYWSNDRVHWAHETLSDVNPGVWEPSYDSVMWQAENKLALLFQSSGLGAATTPVSVMTWDEAAFFAGRAGERVAHATIPAFLDGAYREVPSIVVPKDHVIHDKLFPIEGAGVESDRIAYRVYLDRRNTVDVYGKKLPGVILNKIGQGGGSYHEESDWGMDIWHVGDSLGAGSVGVLDNGMARQIGDPRRIVATVEAAGPQQARLRVDDTGFTLGKRRFNLSARYSIAAGSRLMQVTASASRGTPLVAGIAKYSNTVLIQKTAQSGWGYFATWGRQSENGKDNVGMAFFYPASLIARIGDDGRSLYVLFKNPAQARYAVAAAWEKEGGGIADEAQFRAFLNETVAALNQSPPRKTRQAR